MARIAINGFGRIIQLAFRTLWLRHAELEMVAINDPAGAYTNALLVEFDSSYSTFEGESPVPRPLGGIPLETALEEGPVFEEL